jgi:glutamate--cysteine ligase catalytic subunit
MRRAQQRDAVNQAKFFFRREIFTPASSRATSGATTPNDDSRPSSTSLPNGAPNGMQQGGGRTKSRVMPNCFPPPPAPTPEEAGGSVNEEYAEYTMDEIMNGRVSEAKIYVPKPS